MFKHTLIALLFTSSSIASAFDLYDQNGNKLDWRVIVTVPELECPICEPLPPPCPEPEPCPVPEPEPDPGPIPDPESIPPPPPADLADTELGQIAATLGPGDTAVIDRDPPSAGYRENGSGAPSIDEWTSSKYWHPESRSTWFMGLRKSNRFISYKADTNEWIEYPLEVENAPPRFVSTGHMYERTALDPVRGHFYHARDALFTATSSLKIGGRSFLRCISAVIQSSGMTAGTCSSTSRAENCTGLRMVSKSR